MLGCFIRYFYYFKDLGSVNYLSAYSATKDLNLSQSDRTFINTMMAETALMKKQCVDY